MPVKQKTKQETNLIGDFQNILNKKTYEASAQRGDENSLYVVQPVDIYKFLRDPDYLNLGPEFVLSKAQEELLLKTEDFSSKINTFIVLVGKGGARDG